MLQLLNATQHITRLLVYANDDDLLVETTTSQTETHRLFKT